MAPGLQAAEADREDMNGRRKMAPRVQKADREDMNGRRKMAPRVQKADREDN